MPQSLHLPSLAHHLSAMKPILQDSFAPVAAPVVWWLRLEGFASCALSAVLFAHTGSSWWLFAGLWLLPDLSMLGYLANPRVGAFCYNAVHSYALPAGLAGMALLLHRDLPLTVALIWFNHIGLDRALGYGLKYPSAFGATHLGRQGKSAAKD
jgi:hypothetical protein